MKSCIAIIVSLVTGMTLFASNVHAQPRTVVSPIDEVHADHIVIDNRQYRLHPVLAGVDMGKAMGDHVSEAAFTTEVWDNGMRITYGTILGVGYVDKARITFESNLVTRIEVLEIQQ